MTSVEYNQHRKEFRKKEPEIGDVVAYSLEVYDTGEDVIYTGVIQDIFFQTIQIGKVKRNIKLYKVNDGLAMQRNAFYTMDELFNMKERLEKLLNIE